METHAIRPDSSAEVVRRLSWDLPGRGRRLRETMHCRSWPVTVYI